MCVAHDQCVSQDLKMGGLFQFCGSRCVHNTCHNMPRICLILQHQSYLFNSVFVHKARVDHVYQ